MKQKIYIETTIPSYLVSWPNRDLVVAAHQQITSQWWASQRVHYNLYISQFVLDEASSGDDIAAHKRLAVLKGLSILDIDENTRSLAREIINAGIIPRKKAADAAHISIASVHNMDFLLTWNCEHMANARIEKRIREFCLKQGYICPVICTPEQLMEV